MQADWSERLAPEMQREYFRTLWQFIEEEYAAHTVYPPKDRLFAAFEATAFADTKAVLLGQDPYHGAGQAHGLSFSVGSDAAKFPPSLRNMFLELKDDLGAERTRRDLSDWAAQGVLLLNTVLSVRAGEAGSHRGRGWERFSDAAIMALNARAQPLVFVLWGADAQKKRPLITENRHLVIASAHPSPLSARRGFFGSRPYSRVNAFLRQTGQTEIAWRDPSTA